MNLASKNLFSPIRIPILYKIKTHQINMRKNIQTLILSMFIGGSSLIAQTNDIVMPCATYEAMEKVFQSEAGARERYNSNQAILQQAVKDYEESLKNHKVGAATQYTIPVVFHILHMYGAENIPDANCIAALANMNNDYAASSSDVGTIDPLFASLYINSDIKFMLAHKDPLGNCTSGILHHYNTNTNWNQASPAYVYSGTGVGQWNPTKYLNIYVVNSICPNTATCSSSGGIIVGYTYKPGTVSTGNPADAFVIRASWVNSNITNTRSLSHEIGHWLGLSHPWGNTNNPGVACGDDGVSDTPITMGFFSTCPSSTVGSGCTPSGENVENIMDYSSCPKMFTTGQTNVMRATLGAAVNGRNNLSTATNLGSGVTDVNGTSVCAPIADFYTTYGTAINVYTVCAGGSINFNDVSYNATVTARTWAATGGASITNFTASSTAILFPNAGIQTVSLTVTNGSGSNTLTKTVNVVAGPANYNSTYQESFEASASLPTNWAVINTSGVAWARSTAAAATGTACYNLNNPGGNPATTVDILETPSYDFASNPGAQFTFKYAYAMQSSTWADVFKVQASSNCGGSWTDIYVPTPSFMSGGSGGVTTAPFTPTASTQWKTYTLTTHPAFTVFKSQPNVKIRFYFMENSSALSGNGNNMWLDDINFNGTLGVNELTRSIGFVVYPNPTPGTATLEFTLSESSTISYNVVDVIGRVVETQKPVTISAGQHSYTINESQTFKSGIYFVSFELNGQKMSRKLIVE
jgi:hypothetical protein